MLRRLLIALVLPGVAVVVGACGGKSESNTSSSDASVGGSSGSGGQASDAGGSGGSVPDTGASGAAGDAGCPPTQMACPGCAPDEPPAPECFDRTWVCPDVLCGDAAASCSRGLVPTAQGCLTCAEISDHIGSVIDALLATSTACDTVDDCTYGATSTTCAGACPVAVAKNQQAALETTVNELSADYCQDFVPTCGYSTPKCATASLGCVNGACALVPN